ncbi:MAG: adenylate/guanylate cyclase domain-containing protein [Actinomycetota bacterium]|nr:adenylate/guanylate cyclase domain-containing protein [Actinomycetota bacterium]
MKCPNCEHENPADAKFCAQCGNSLSITCPVCSTPADPGDKFCSNCGASLTSEEQPDDGSRDDLARYLPQELLAKMSSARAGKAMLGERRTVTMLFADITGSTAAAEQLDPEDWAEIMNGAFEHLISPIYRYEGTLAQLRGDAILAFFGAPIAHEDDPIRALRAGVEMVAALEGYSGQVKKQWGMPVQVRVGINTGLVVVGELGSDLRVEYSALGDAINVAARMEQTAEPGTVRVTEDTLFLAGDAFEVEGLGPIEVKGKSEPVNAYRVLDYVGAERTVAVLPLLGRKTELANLDELRSRLTEGSGWIASIIAEAGVGKSRLIDEFRKRTGDGLTVAEHSEESGDLAWLTGSSRSYDSGNPFSTLRDLLREWWDIQRDDDGFDIVESSTTAAGLDDPDMPAFLAHLAEVALPQKAQEFIDALETPALHARSGEALSTYIAALAAIRPTIIVLEDLHWADDLSLALIESLMDLTERNDLGLVLAMRPYRDEPPWRIHEVAERDHHHRYHNLNLAPLAQDESDSLLDSLLDDKTLPEAVKRTILERSDGNPLFIEEMARSLGEIGVDDPEELAVPSSLAGILTARLDRLEEESRYVVQVASVLGSEFDRETLSVLVEHSAVQIQVTELLRKGILIEVGEKREALAFRHALIQETAYETILRRTRRELHRRVADYLVETRPEDAPGVARHMVEAGDLQDAFPYLVEAGRRAARSMALADAIRLVTTAVDNTPADADPELVEQAHETLGEAYALVPNLSQAAGAYQRLFEYGERTEQPSIRVSALNRLGYATAMVGGDLAGANSYLLDAKALAEETEDEIGLAEYHMNACLVASLAGQVGEAVAHDEATVELGKAAGINSIFLSGLVRRATNYVAMVDLEKGVPAMEAALEQTRESDQEEAIAIVEALGLGVVRYIQGDVRGSLDVADGVQKTLERYSSFYVAINQRNIGALLYELSDLEGALGRFVDTVRLGTRAGQPFAAGAGASGMALVYATAGMVDQVSEQRAVADASTQNPLGDFMGSNIWGDLGFANLMLDRVEEAAADFARGLEAASIHQYLERPRLLAGRALARLAAGDREGAEADLGEAQEFVEDHSYVAPRSLLGYVDGLIKTHRQDFDAATEALESAQQKAMDRGQRLLTVQIRQARAQLALLVGDGDQARAHLEDARAVVNAIAEEIADEHLRDAFSRKWLEAVPQITTE